MLPIRTLAARLPTATAATARITHTNPVLTLCLAFHSSPAALSKQLPPRRVIPESEIIENFLKGTGPGGQKINKTSSAVQLKHIPTGIVVKYQDTRSRAQNRKIARRLLQDRIEELELGDEARTRIKAREKSKKKASSDKKKRRKYRALEEAKAGGAAEDRNLEDGLAGDEVVEEADTWEDAQSAPEQTRGTGG